jgi:hypothetical protein
MMPSKIKVAGEVVAVSSETVGLAIQSLPPIRITYLSALTTPAIALLAVVVAFAQWRIASNKLKLDLFEQRFAMYDVTRKLVHQVNQGPDYMTLQSAFLNETVGARWLFGPDVGLYVDTVWEKLSALQSMKALQSQSLVSRQKMSAIDAASLKVLQDWFKDQVVNKRVDAEFGPYLALRG